MKDKILDKLAIGITWAGITILMVIGIVCLVGFFLNVPLAISLIVITAVVGGVLMIWSTDRVKNRKL